jgi:cyanate permease
MLIRVHRLIRKFNFIHLLLDNLLGSEHTHAHRMGCGAFVMALGVAVAHYFAAAEIEVLRMAADGVGYLIHAIGAMPVADYMVGKINSGGDK